MPGTVMLGHTYVKDGLLSLRQSAGAGGRHTGSWHRRRSTDTCWEGYVLQGPPSLWWSPARRFLLQRTPEQR